MLQYNPMNSAHQSMDHKLESRIRSFVHTSKSHVMTHFLLVSTFALQMTARTLVRVTPGAPW